jgi:hypothetical protein
MMNDERRGRIEVRAVFSGFIAHYPRLIIRLTAESGPLTPNYVIAVFYVRSKLCYNSVVL